jgi:hypothetical protein
VERAIVMQSLNCDFPEIAKAQALCIASEILCVPRFNILASPCYIYIYIQRTAKVGCSCEILCLQ